MSGLMRKAAAAVLVFGLAWAGTIAYWRQTGSTPGGMEMLAMLGLLPAGVLGGGWMLRGLAQRALDASANRASSTDAAAPPAADVPAAADASPPPRPLALLAASVRLPLGLEPAGLLADPLVLARPRAHPNYRDSSGLPIYLAMADDLDASVLPAELDNEQTEHIRRALALLAPVAEDLLLQAAQALPAAAQSEGRVVAGWRRQVAEVVEHQLSIELLVPSAWSMALREACADWLRHSAQQLGIDARRFDVQLLPADDAGEVWAHLRQRMEASAQATPGWQLLLACHSTVGRASLERWEASGRLRSPANSGGQVPGEAAAGVLLAWPAAQAVPWLRSVERAELPDHSGVKARTRCTGELAGASLERAAVEPSRIDLVLSDADLRADPAVEASSAAHRVCVELDLSRQYLALSTSSGEIGPVQPLAQLALADAHLDAGGEAVMMLAVSPASTRWAAVLAPSSSPDQAGLDDVPAADAAQPEPV
ncbi:MAG: hypothetical protein QM581_14560 [Pseudomonas sp.]